MSINRMLNCKQVTNLVSKSLERRLSFVERMNLWVHIGMCRTCRLFRRFQIQLHHTISSNFMESDEGFVDSETRLSQSARQRISGVMKSDEKTK